MRIVLLTLILFLVTDLSAFAEDLKSVIKENFILESQFRGPHADTIIQRWYDQKRKNICYLYIPITVPNLPPNPAAPKGPVSYGPNTIGTISCVKE